MAARTTGERTGRWTLRGVKTVFSRTLREKGIEAEIVSAKWLGDWAKGHGHDDFRSEFYGREYRTAEVVVRSNSGRKVARTMTVENNGGWRI